MLFIYCEGITYELKVRLLSRDERHDGQLFFVELVALVCRIRIGSQLSRLARDGSCLEGVKLAGSFFALVSLN